MSNLQHAGKVKPGEVFQRFLATQVGDVSKAKSGGRR